MNAEKEKMSVDVLSYLRTHTYAGFNEIGRFLASKGYSPLYKGGHYSGGKMLHPSTTESILKHVSDELWVTSDYPLGKSNRGKPNRFSLTDRGKAHLEKKWMIRFIERSDINEIKIPSVTFERALLKAEKNLDSSSIKISTPMGPGDRLTCEEDRFLAQKNIKITARRLLDSWSAKLLVLESSRSIKLSESEVEDLCMLMACYDNGKTAFSFVLSYDPTRYDLETNPQLFKDLSHLELNCFCTWLHIYKGISKDQMNSMLPFLFEKHEVTKELSKENDQFKALWAEYISKTERVNHAMDEIRRFANKVALDNDRIIDFARSHEGKELAKKMKFSI